jgi:hypothetical protein
MKKNIIALALLCSSVAALAIGAPARAETGKSAIGPFIGFGSGNTAFGVDAKFGVSDNLSIRPFIAFPSGGTLFGTSLTYDFEVGRGSKNAITPFLGGGVIVASGNGSNTFAYFTGGADFGITDSIDLKAELDVPFSGGNTATIIRLGAGFKF